MVVIRRSRPEQTSFHATSWRLAEPARLDAAPALFGPHDRAWPGTWRLAGPPETTPRSAGRRGPGPVAGHTRGGLAATPFPARPAAFRATAACPAVLDRRPPPGPPRPASPARSTAAARPAGLGPLRPESAGRPGLPGWPRPGGWLRWCRPASGASGVEDALPPHAPMGAQQKKVGPSRHTSFLTAVLVRRRRPEGLGGSLPVRVLGLRQPLHEIFVQR